MLLHFCRRTKRAGPERGRLIIASEWGLCYLLPGSVTFAQMRPTDSIGPIFLFRREVLYSPATRKTSRQAASWKFNSQKRLASRGPKQTCFGRVNSLVGISDASLISCAARHGFAIF